MAYRNLVKVFDPKKGEAVVILSFPSNEKLQPFEAEIEARKILGNETVTQCWHNLCFDCEPVRRN